MRRRCTLGSDRDRRRRRQLCLNNSSRVTDPPDRVDRRGGNAVAAVLRFGGRAKLSGLATDSTFGVVFWIRDGKIARGREYATREQALEAAGLSE
jgi:ketosteroid isomerase-like protein